MVDELYPINSCVTFVYMQMTLGNKGPFFGFEFLPNIPKNNSTSKNNAVVGYVQ